VVAFWKGAEGFSRVSFLGAGVVVTLDELCSR
jgi:hypothetical protein